MNKKAMALGLGMALAACLVLAESNDWYQWGGPDRNFQASPDGIADAWPEGGPKELWSRTLGDGHSAIAAVGGKLYTMYRARPEGLAENEFGGEEAIIALDAATGETLWEHTYASEEMNFRFGAGPHSTPLVVGGRVFAVGTNKQFHALDADTGEVLWAYDLVEEMDATPALVRSQVKAGYGSNPIAYEDTVIAVVGGEGQAVVAFDQSDGKVVWKTGDFLVACAAPILIDVDGQTQLVVVGGETAYGLDPATGDVLWQHDQQAPGDMNNSTPVFGDNRLYMSVAYGIGGRALDLSRSASGSEAKEAWFSKDLQLMFSNGLLLGDFVVGSSGDFGPAFMVALDWKTGERLWRERGFGRSSLLQLGDKTLILDEDGTLSLAKLSREGLEVISQAEVLTGRAWTVPTPVGSTIYLRDRQVIKALDLGE